MGVDWKTNKGLGPWAFTEQPNKWGYLNNPRWASTSFMPPVNYDGVESTEPQVWSTDLDTVNSSGTIKKHIPCGHWHKKITAVPSTLLPPAYAFVGMNSYNGRLVKLATSPFARASYFDPSDDLINNSILCFGLSYDVTNSIIYMGLNYYDDSSGDEDIRIVKVNATTMEEIAHLTLVTDAVLSHDLKGMNDHPENGFIYASVLTNTGSVNTIYKINLATFTIDSQAVYAPGAKSNRNALYPDSARGFLYFCDTRTASLGGTGALYRMAVSTLAVDATNLVITSHQWGISGGQMLDKNTGNFFCGYPTGPTYYPSLYTLVDIDVDIMAVSRSVSLPVDGGYGIDPRKMDISDNYIYILGSSMRIPSVGGSAIPYLITIDRATFTVVDSFQLSAVGNVVGIGGYDLGIFKTEKLLAIYTQGTDGVNPGELYMLYDISTGIPVYSNHVFNSDPNAYELGDIAATLISGN